MMILCVLLGAIIAVVAVVVFVKGVRGLALARRVLAQPTTPTAKIAAGPVEVAGTVESIGEPVISAGGERCIAVHTKVLCRKGRGKGSSVVGTPTKHRFAETRLTDRTGTCRVDLACSQIVGPRRSTGVVDRGDIPAEPWLVDMLPPEADNFEIEETVIPLGATVLVSGEAAETGARVDAGAYRGAAVEWTIGGRPEHLLVVSVGGQARLLFASVLPALLLLSIAGYLAFVAFLTIVAAT